MLSLCSRCALPLSLSLPPCKPSICCWHWHHLRRRSRHKSSKPSKPSWMNRIVCVASASHGLFIRAFTRACGLWWKSTIGNPFKHWWRAFYVSVWLLFHLLLLWLPLVSWECSAKIPGYAGNDQFCSWIGWCCQGWRILWIGRFKPPLSTTCSSICPGITWNQSSSPESPSDHQVLAEPFEKLSFLMLRCLESHAPYSKIAQVYV